MQLRGYLLTLAALSAATPASAASLDAYLSRSGEVTLRRPDTGAIVAAVKPGIFEATWQLRNVAPAPGLAGDDVNGVIRTSDGKGSVRVTGDVKVAGTRLRLRYTLTPDTALQVNSIHASVSVPVRPWTGAQLQIPGQPEGVVPEVAKAINLTGSVPAITLSRGDRKLALLPEGVPVMLQDNRAFGAQELELRVGPQDGQGRAWAAGQTQTIAFSLDLGESITLLRDRPITLTAGKDWVPLDWKQEIVKGSALDLSALNDGPAGKYGWVIAGVDGHFHFERSQAPVRFYGGNLCFSANYLEKAEADRLADRLARFGYNAIRIHHYEGELVDPKAADSVTFRPDSLDKLDYLVAALKKRGIYVTTDLFVSRPVRPQEGPSYDDYKMALLVSPTALKNWETFSAKLLRHVNPYTHLAWKDDPTVAWISVVNEPNAVGFLGRLQGELHAQFEAEWHRWLQGHYATDAALATAWKEAKATRTAPLPKSVDDSPRGRDTATFLTSLHEKAYARMSAFLKKDVGTRALLTYLNGWSETPAFMAARTAFDYVDNHFYWDHPRFLERDWQLPSEGGSGGGTALAAGGAGPDSVAKTRLWGKPFAVSEYNYSAPNPYRAEGGLLMGAAAALQDWDVVWRFAYAHSREQATSPQPVDYFNMADDPAGASSELAAAFLFRRADALPLPRQEIAFNTREQLFSGEEAPLPSNDLWTAILGRQVVQIGSKPRKTSLSHPAGSSEQVQIDPEHTTMRIDTPRFAACVAPAGVTLTSGALRAEVQDARAVVWAASLDRRPLTASRHLLLAHVTDVQNSGMRYAGPDRRVLQDWGKLPHLVRTGTARITLPAPAGAHVHVWRLDTAGNRQSEVPAKVTGGKLILDLTTRAPNGKATLFYEVVE